MLLVWLNGGCSSDIAGTRIDDARERMVFGRPAPDGEEQEQGEDKETEQQAMGIGPEQPHKRMRWIAKDM